MKKFLFIANDYERTRKTVDYIKYKFESAGFIQVTNDPDFVLILGGDGTFLDACKLVNYNSNILFVGINFGTLGYLLDISNNQIEELIEYLKIYDNSDITLLEHIKLLEITLHYSNTTKTDTLYAINELTILGNNLSKILFQVSTDNGFFQKFLASAVTIATPTGTTGINKSNNSSIMLFNADLLTLSSTLAIRNCNCEDFVSNPLIYPMFNIQILNNFGHFNLSIDGKPPKEIEENLMNVSKIELKISDKKITKLNFNNIPFGKKIVDKLIRKN